MPLTIQEGFELSIELTSLIKDAITKWEATADEPGVSKDEAILNFVVTEIPTTYKFVKKAIAEAKD